MLEFGIVKICLTPLATYVDVGRFKKSRTKVDRIMRNIGWAKQDLPFRPLILVKYSLSQFQKGDYKVSQDHIDELEDCLKDRNKRASWI